MHDTQKRGDIVKGRLVNAGVDPDAIRTMGKYATVYGDEAITEEIRTLANDADDVALTSIGAGEMTFKYTGDGA